MGPGEQFRPNPAGWEIQKFTYENPWTRETIEQDRVFIPSKLRDNKFLGPEYVANLQMVGSDTLVRAWLEGDWTVIEGAYFDCWRYDQHVVEPFEVPAHWARFRSMDWGSAKPFSVGWWAIVGDDHAPCGKILSAARSCGTASGTARCPERRAQDDRRGRGRGDRRARTQRSHSPLWGSRSRVLQGGWRAFDRGADQQGAYCGSSAAISRRRQFPRPAPGIDGRLGSAALPPSRPRWPSHDLLLQHARCEH